MDSEHYLSLYYKMVRIRSVEEAIADAYPEQKMRCPVHLCIGQEAVAAGVCAHLRREDYLMSNHRSHGHYLAKGGNLKAMIAEIAGKKTGCSGGKGGSMHLVDLDENIMGTTPIVGSIIPIATGIAFGTSLKGEKNITAVFFGDAATEEGVFFESLNFAALKVLPILFVCENNFFSVYSPLSVRQPEKRNNTAIANAFGISGLEGDGNDAIQVSKLARQAVEHIREGKGPFYLEFTTYRWREHCGPFYDNHLGYRSENECQEWEKKCPIKRLKEYLIKEGMLGEEEDVIIREKIYHELNEAFQHAEQSSLPDSGSLLEHLYSGS